MFVVVLAVVVPVVVVGVAFATEAAVVAAKAVAEFPSFVLKLD